MATVACRMKRAVLMQKPTFYEFFAGGGMARAGLGPGWTCLFANDFDAKKAASYAANWGAEHFRLGDIHALTAADLPGQADLAWASFPCQDLSLAGMGAGLKGGRSGAFWGFWDIIHGLKLERRSPKILVLENVTGALTSNGGKDFLELCKALRVLGYAFGALTIDAVHFLPQSRPRLFVLALRKDLEIAPELTADQPSLPWASDALLRAREALPPYLKRDWLWWNLPAPTRRNTSLAQMIEPAPSGVGWHTREETARLIAMMSEANAAKLKAARSFGKTMVGTIYRRTRHDESGAKVQRAEVRFDGIAGCLRTPGGGSSRQTVIIVEGKSVRTRLMSPREAARLMGMPEDYVLPDNYNDAYHLLGDGVAVPVVGFLEGALLRPILSARVPTPFLAAAE